MASVGWPRSPERPTRSLQLIIRDIRGGIKNLYDNFILILPRATTRYFTESSSPIESPDLPELVALFDDEHRGNCFKLDVTSFYCILLILLRSLPCIARERGFYLFLCSLRFLTSVTLDKADVNMQAARDRKTTLGSMCLDKLFSVFVHENMQLARTWSAQFILELIRDCKDNLNFLVEKSAKLRVLGQILLNGKDYDLRLLSAMIIQQLVFAELDPALLWPPDIDPRYASWFSRAAVVDVGWLEGVSNLFSMIDDDRMTNESNRHNTAFRLTTMKAVKFLRMPGFEFQSEKAPIGVISKNDNLSFYVVNGDRIRIIEVPMNFVRETRVIQENPPTLKISLVEGSRYFADGLTVNAGRIEVVLIESGHVAEIQLALSRDSGCETITIASSTSTDSHQEGPKTGGKQVLNCHAVSNTIILPDTDEESDGSLPRVPKRPLEQVSEVEETKSKRFQGMASSMAIELPGESSPESEYKVRRNVKSSETHRKTSMESVESGYGSFGNDSPMTAHDGKSKSSESQDQPAIAGSSKQRCDEEVQGRCGSAERGAMDLLNAVIKDTQRRASQSTKSITKPDHDSNVEFTESRCIETTAAADQNTSPGSMKPTPISKPAATAGGSKEVNGPTSATGSRLKRPHHKINGHSNKAKAVDWDEDIRVDDPKEQLSIAKKRKITPAKSAVPKHRASTGATRDVPRMLCLSPRSPEIKSAPVKRQVKHEQHQVTKTLTSTRQRRAAANRAIEKLARATEEENLPYDVDDPIESSIPEPPKATDNSNFKQPNVRPSGLRSPRLHSDESNSQYQGDGTHNITLDCASPFSGFSIPNLKSSDRNTIGKLEVGPLFTRAKRSNGSNEKGTSSTKKHKRKYMEVEGSLVNDAIVQDISNPAPLERRKKTYTDDAKRPQEKECATLEIAGISPKNEFQNVTSTLKRGEGGSKLSNDINPSLFNTTAKASQVSRNVSLFIARQTAEGQHVDAIEGDKGETGRKSPNVKTTSEMEKSEEELSISSDKSARCSRTNEENSNAPNSNEVQSRIDNEQRASAPTPPLTQKNSHTEPTQNQRFSRTQTSNTKPEQCQQSIPGTVGNCADKNTIGATKQTKLSPGLDSIDDTSRNMESSLSSETGPEHECPSLSGRSGIIAKNADLHRDTDDSDSDNSVYVMSRDEFIQRCHRRRPLNSQRTVDENGSPQPRQYSKDSQFQSKPDCGDLKSQLNPSLAERNNFNTGNFKGDREGLFSETNSDDHSVISVSLDTPSDRSSYKEEPDNANQTEITSAALETTTKRGGPISRQNQPSKFLEKLQQAREPRGSIRVQKPCRLKIHDPEVRVTQVSAKDSSQDDETGRSEIENNVESTSSDVVSTSVPAFSSEPSSEFAVLTWEEALRDTYKSTLDILLEISSRLVGQLGGEEDVLKDLVDAYEKGGNKLIDQLEQAHYEVLTDVEKQRQPIMAKLNQICQAILQEAEKRQKTRRDVESEKELNKTLERILREVQATKNAGRREERLEGVLTGIGL